MSKMIRVRPFTPSEWKTYQDLRLRALADAPDAFGSTLAREQDHPDSLWESRLADGQDRRWNLPLVAEVNGEPAGMAWGRIEEDDPDRAYLYQMWVAPEYRQRGVGEKLLNEVIRWARECDASTLHLGVTVRNSPAMRLYLRAGFEPDGEPGPLRPGSDLMEQSMRLKLRKDN
ncbi:GNAT family N-acetyltransferase [Chloroflexota bacterium]